MVSIVGAVQPSQFLVARHSVHNSLQFFQWLVFLKRYGQSYGSSVSQIITSNTADMNTLELHVNSMLLLLWQWQLLIITGAKWYSLGLQNYIHFSHISDYHAKHLSMVVTQLALVAIATECELHFSNTRVPCFCCCHTDNFLLPIVLLWLVRWKYYRTHLNLCPLRL